MSLPFSAANSRRQATFKSPSCRYLVFHDSAGKHYTHEWIVQANLWCAIENFWDFGIGLLNLIPESTKPLHFSEISGCVVRDPFRRSNIAFDVLAWYLKYGIHLAPFSIRAIHRETPIIGRLDNRRFWLVHNQQFGIGARYQARRLFGTDACVEANFVVDSDAAYTSELPAGDHKEDNFLGYIGDEKAICRQSCGGFPIKALGQPRQVRRASKPSDLDSMIEWRVLQLCDLLAAGMLAAMDRADRPPAKKRIANLVGSTTVPGLGGSHVYPVHSCVRPRVTSAPTSDGPIEYLSRVPVGPHLDVFEASEVLNQYAPKLVDSKFKYEV